MLFRSYVDHYSTVSRNNGQNPCIGLSLPGMFQDEPLLEGVTFDVIQPCHHEGPGKWMAYNTMDKIKDTVLQQRLADQAAIDKVLSDLKRFTTDDRSIISLPRIFRVTGVKR